MLRPDTRFSTSESWARAAGPGGAQRYSSRSLRRVWQIQYFSSWMTRMLHRFNESTSGGPENVDYDYHVQLGQLSLLTSSERAMSHLAEVYTGLPMLMRHS